MKMNEEMLNALQSVGSGGVVVHLTTCSADGVSNVVGERFVASYGDEHIVIADMFAQKTKVNLNENPVGIITVAHPTKARYWAFRGPCTIIMWGEDDDYDFHGVKAGEVLREWGDWATKEPPSEVPPDIRPPALCQRGVITLKVDDAYSWFPNESGKKIL
ncbi:MAG: pyridoxamine 5'-phosphate oxidase family protein [Gallionella sp.]|nr:pyridoxamine 5'-phosphate oxidase family protein [Gallionella sp.]